MLDFIVNPMAGGKNLEKTLQKLIAIENVLKEKKIEYKIHFTERKHQAKELTSEIIKNGATDIIVVGGDGTLHEVINGFTDFDKVNLGLIPCGTGNDFAAAINIPLDSLEALDIILNEKPKFTDFLQMPTVRGINIIGMGIDVDVLKKYEALKKKTKFGYTMCLVKTLLKFDYSEFKAEFDGKTESYKSFIACIANGYRYGGGIPICPPAVATDNLLDFAAIRSMRKPKIVYAFIKLKKGKILSLKESVHFRTEKIKIIPNGDYTVNVDGELYENIPFEIEVVKNKLKMYRK